MRRTVKAALLGLLVAAGSAHGEAPCPDANYFGNLIDKFCWSCTLPYNLAGFASNIPAGANDKAFCNCTTSEGLPSPGVSFGYWSPDHLIEVGMTPWCSPTLGGTLLDSSLTMLGKPASSDPSVSTMSTMHFNYMISPVFKMLGLFLIPECDTSPGFTDLDIGYMSIVDPTFYNSPLSYLFTPDAIPIANPIGRAACIADGVASTLSGEAMESNWFCAGLDGHLYPLVGHITGDHSFLRNTQLITTRAIASLHRRGIARQTLGKEAMCQATYAPMIPKAQYKISMMFPSPEANPASAVAAAPDGASGDGWSSCCHPLGHPPMWWGAGRSSPGLGKDMFAVYSVFRYTDCCIRFAE